MHLNYPQKSNGLYILNRDNIDDIATGILTEHMPAVLKHPSAVDIQWLAEEEYGLEIKHKFITYNASVLGMILFAKNEIEILDDMFNKVCSVEEEGTIIIERTLTGRSTRPRYRFTLAHEVSHWMIHRSFHSPTNKQYECRTSNTSYIACRSSDIEKATSYNNSDIEWQEWQADALAAALLMPKDPFTWACMEAFRIHGYYRIPHTYEVSRQTLYNVTDMLSNIFKVSHQAAKIRMNNLGIYSEARRYAV